ncbi:MAG: SDR family oxidoreductase [Deltaproteobacteria bacterium]|nr:SDR family oxidoreductase [Deltaproteobacteria bacterium]MBW2307325.1 SDR family oxidoreductase [Deltaproteobacteria bacterium]
MKFLVTGGAGFIGSNLVEALLGQGGGVRVLDNFSTGQRKNLNFGDKVEVIEGDIRDAEMCARACRDADMVFHLAALGSVPRSVEDPVTTHEVNITGTLNMLLAARDEPMVKRFIFASSSSVYGDPPGVGENPKREDMPLMPLSPYAASKVAGEHYCSVFHKVYGLETVILRYFNVFGPRQNADSPYASVIPRFIRFLREDKSPLIYGDGQQSRDFCYVENVVHANILCAQAEQGAVGACINVAGGQRFSVNELLSHLCRIMGKSTVPVHEPPRPGDVRHSRADIGLASRLLGYEPMVGFEEGLRRAVDWFVSSA